MSGTPAMTGSNRPSDPNHQYPHPFFGISDKYIPTTAKEMYRWAQYIYTVNPTFSQVIRKMAGYVTTDLIYDTKDEKAVSLWKEVLDKQLQYKRFEKRMLLDLLVFGNSYARFIWPSDKYLVCQSCQNEFQLKGSDWKIERFKFSATCPRCKATGEKKAIEKTVKNRRRIKLIRLDPRLIQPIYEPVTQTYVYTYTVPRSVASVLRSTEARKEHIKLFVEELPLTVIEAVKTNSLVKFSRDELFHMKSDSISHDDESLGEIPFLPVFKVIWLYHTIWRAQEAVSLERIVPWTAISPRATASQDPIGSINLDEWKTNLQTMINNWRRDPNFIGTMPYPMDVTNLRGEGKALDNWQGLTHLRDVMAGGMGVPPSFIYGGSVYSGANVELRVLENDLRNYVLQLEDMLSTFVTPKLAQFASLPKIDIRHENFKMADDIQQKSLITSLRSEGLISEETLINELGFNYDAEQKKGKAERDVKRSEQMAQMKEQQELQLAFAKQQGEMQMELAMKQQAMQFEMQLEQQGRMQQQQMDQMAANGLGPDGQPMQPGMPPGMQPGMQPGMAPPGGQQPGMPKGASGMARTPDLTEMMARDWMGTFAPAQRKTALMQLQRTDPELAEAVKNKMAMHKREAADSAKPLNPVRPPSGAGATI